MRPRCFLVLAVCALLPGYTGGYNLKPADVAARAHRRNKRKNWEPWDFNHPSLKARKDDILSRRMPNILFIVADDLVRCIVACVGCLASPLSHAFRGMVILLLSPLLRHDKEMDPVKIWTTGLVHLVDI